MKNELKRRKAVRRRLLTINTLGNFFGAIITYSLFTFITYGRNSSSFSLSFSDIAFILAIILLLIFFGVSLSQRRESLMWSWYFSQEKRDPPEKIRKIALNLPIQSAIMTKAMWMVAGIISSITALFISGSFSLRVFLSYFLGIGVVSGFIASSLIYFANERAWIPEIPLFFAQRLPRRGEIIKVSLTRKLLLLLLAQMVPLFLLGIIAFNLANQDSDSHMIYLIPFMVAFGIMLAILFSKTLGATLVHGVKTLNHGMVRVQRGDFKAQAPLVSSDELGELALGFKEMVKGLDHLNESIQKAKSIHSALLPSILPKAPGYSFSSYYQPADTIGGDFYNCIQQDKEILFYIADVTGHGLDGAMLNIFLRETINSYLKGERGLRERLSPQEIISYVVESYHQESFEADYFICLFVGVLHTEKSIFTFSDAGFHIPPLILNQGGAFVKSNCGGLPISTAIPKELLDYREERVDLYPGGTILLTTDGLIEEEKDGAKYGEERLRSVFQENHLLPVDLLQETIFNDYISFAGYLKGKDDITMIVVRKNTMKCMQRN